MDQRTTLVVAVSGGVDSVVLLDFLSRQQRYELVMAHFEHGIRGEASQADARFVEYLSQKYRVKYEIGYGNLSKSASEADAREKRYAFLKGVASKYGGRIVTAHHLDDLVETVAINLVRGTGWRGLAVFGNASLLRPLLRYQKSELYDYALRHRLEWVEDETNRTDAYLRNRLRSATTALPLDIKRQLATLREAQRALRVAIDLEAAAIIGSGPEFSRHPLIVTDATSASELLRAAVKSATGYSPTRPQLDRALLAIKTARPGTLHSLGGGVRLRFGRRHFLVEDTRVMV